MYLFQRKKKGHFGGVHFYQCKIYMYRPVCMGRVTLNVMAVFNKATLLMYAVYLQVHPTTYNEELSLLTVHKRTNMAPK